MMKEIITITENKTIITDGIRRYAIVGLVLFLFSCNENKNPQRDADGHILKNGQFYDNQESETG